MSPLSPQRREIVARLQSGRLMICDGQGDPNSDGCGGQGYTGAAGQEPCPHCYGAGVMTPELRVALASAPSPEAGAGGDLGGEPFGTGSREPRPTVPAYGFDPSRVEAAAQAYYDGMIGDERTQWPHHDGWAGKSEAFKSKVRAHMARALEAALGTEARSAETFGLGPKDDGPACKATPEATPKSSPSQTPVDPPMTVEEARDLLKPLRVPPETAITNWRQRAQEAGFDLERKTYEARADEVEAALRTLQAAGEVR